MSNHKTNKQAIFVFPGIGVKLHNREKLFFQEHQSVFSPIFESGSQSATIDLSRALMNDIVETTLSELQMQIFTYCFSIGTSQIYKNKGWNVKFTSGNSFGIYAALHTAGVISFKDGLLILSKAHKLLKDACKNSKTSLSVIIGLNIHEIQSIIQSHSLRSLERISSINELCHLICGLENEIESYNNYARDMDAISATTLNTSLPYHHTKFTNSVAKPFKTFLRTLTWNNSNCHFISTINQQAINSPNNFLQFTVDQITQPISWFETIKTMYTKNISHYFECGPGISLTQNARFIDGRAIWINTKNFNNKINS